MTWLDDEAAFQLAKQLVVSAGTPPPGEWLLGLVRYLRPDTIVEVGAWQGYSTLHLAKGCRENDRIGRVYAIDNWSLAGGSADIIRRALHIARLEHYATLIEGDSLQVEWPKIVDFAFIDGNHSFDYCRREVEIAISRSAKTIVVHDTTNWWGPRKWLACFRASDAAAAWDITEFPHGDGAALLQRRVAKPEPQFTEAQYPRGFI